MIRPTRRFTFLAIGLAALLLAGCAGSDLQGAFGSKPATPKAIYVSDFVVSSDVDTIDRGFSIRMDRKGGNYPILERKRRTLGRVNDEIVATIVATLREAGLNAQPGNEDALTLSDNALIVTGRLRPTSLSDLAKGKPVVFGTGRPGNVSADMTVSYFSGRGKKQLTTFNVDTRGAGKLPVGKQAAAFNAGIAESLVAEKALPERLSPDIEGAARRLGRAAGEKIVAYVKGQGWLTPPEAAEAQPAGEEQRVRMPDPRPEPRAGNKSPQADPQTDPQDEPDDLPKGNN
jgi:hypothetical protein